MRRALLSITLAFSLSPLFSAIPAIQDGLTDESFYGFDTVYYSTRTMLNSREGRSAFYGNPAALADDPYFFYLPLSASLANASALLKADLLNTIPQIMGFNTAEKLAKTADLLSILTGRSPLFFLNESISFAVDGFGLSLSLRQGVLAYGESVGSRLIASTDVKGSLGYGHRFDFTDDIGLSAGIMLNTRSKFYSQDVGLEILVGILTGTATIDRYATFEGVAVSLDIGARLDLPRDFSLAFTVKDISTGYHMKTRNGGDTYPESFTIAVAPSYNAGIAWSPSWRIVSTRFEADLIGIEEIIRAQSKEAWLEALALGAEVDITRHITLSGGIYQGYPSFGLALRALGLELSAAYYVFDAGSDFALRSNDILSIQLAISF